MAIPADAVHAIQWVAYHYRRLDKEADIALHTHNDLARFEAKLRAAGRLILALPEVIRDLLDDSPESAHVLDAIETMADQVQRFMLSDNYLGIGSFLIPHGSGIDDPNHLERLGAAHSTDGY